MNVNRRMPNGLVNPYEPHQAQLYMTSAAQKSTYAYSKMIELFEQEIINPKQAFVWGTSYQVPMIHGLISKQYLNEVRTAPTFSADSWAREQKNVLVKFYKLLGVAQSLIYHNVIGNDKREGLKNIKIA